jgi:drug/metabolite transporter (DMT)-like permease
MPTLLLVFSLYVIGQGLYIGCLKSVQQNYIRNTGHSFFYSATSAAFQALFVIILPPYVPLVYNADALTLGAAFTVFNLFGVLLMFRALSLGPMGLTNVVTIVRNFFPIIAGVLFWNESVTIFQGLGLLVFLAALGMINLTNRQGSERKPTLKWMIAALGSGMVTGLAVCISKLYGFAQPVAFKEYLIAFNAILALALIPYLIICWRRQGLDKLARQGKFWLMSMLSALGMAAANIIFMYYINAFSSALYFPMLAILSMLTTVAVGRLVYKERLNWMGLVGVGLSMVAIVLLNF